ncbi:MAG: hypothetical protein V3V08_02645 [Nannocystaceae bacterium]
MLPTDESLVAVAVESKMNTVPGCRAQNAPAIAGHAEAAVELGCGKHVLGDGEVVMDGEHTKRGGRLVLPFERFDDLRQRAVANSAHPCEPARAGCQTRRVECSDLELQSARKDVSSCHRKMVVSLVPEDALEELVVA